jgi:hypothetical protein
MRKVVIALGGLFCMLLLPAGSRAQQPDIVEAARKAREQRKTAPKAKVVFTNDNIPKQGGISTGTSGAVAAGDTRPAAGPGRAAAPATESESAELNEAEWRKKFSDLRQQIAAAEKELELLKREQKLNELQYYSDPNKALREQYSRSEINEGKAKIDAKTQEVVQLKQKLSTLEDELRQKGGPAAWAREP